ncbi:MAG: fumarylacetoacetate hydrolase family protein [Candidatus Caldarchaeum sp.]
MRLLTFSYNGVDRVGLLVDGMVVDMASVYQSVYGDDHVPSWLVSMRSLLAASEHSFPLVERLAKEAKGLDKVKPHFYSVDEVIFKPPVPDPKKIFCVAANYVAHSQEMTIKVPEKPYFFSKFTNTLIGHEHSILIPKTSVKVDYEIELAVVIGKRGKYIPRDKAEEYIAGYTVFNDVSFRDKQFPAGWPQQLNPFGQNWIHGKGLDNAAPCGPYLVTKDEVGSPYSLRLTLKVNGEVRQDGYTRDMYHKIGDLIEYLSDGITLEPGDIIATGTPAGVAAAGKEYLKDKDVVEAEITELGLLRNRVVKE